MLIGVLASSHPLSGKARACFGDVPGVGCPDPKAITLDGRCWLLGALHDTSPGTMHNGNSLIMYANVRHNDIVLWKHFMHVLKLQWCHESARFQKWYELFHCEGWVGESMWSAQTQCSTSQWQHTRVFLKPRLARVAHYTLGYIYPTCQLAAFTLTTWKIHAKNHQVKRTSMSGYCTRISMAPVRYIPVGFKPAFCYS